MTVVGLPHGFPPRFTLELHLVGKSLGPTEPLLNVYLRPKFSENFSARGYILERTVLSSLWSYPSRGQEEEYSRISHSNFIQ